MIIFVTGWNIKRLPLYLYLFFLTGWNLAGRSFEDSSNVYARLPGNGGKSSFPRSGRDRLTDRQMRKIETDKHIKTDSESLRERRSKK
jgi:hypothetical protein